MLVRKLGKHFGQAGLGEFFDFIGDAQIGLVDFDQPAQGQWEWRSKPDRTECGGWFLPVRAFGWRCSPWRAKGSSGAR